MKKSEELKIINFDVTEIWTMVCPHCEEEDTAPFNDKNPMQPMKINCNYCNEEFILTYDRD